MEKRKIIFAGKSDIGRKRPVNQDALCMCQKDDAGLFVIADGMGGHSDGEKASRRVVRELTDWWDAFSPDSFGYDFFRMLSSIKMCIENANRMIFTEYNQNGVCGTTVTALFLFRNMYGLVYAGDTRCYLWHKGSLFQRKRWGQLTVDEVWENQSGISDRERLKKNHPNRGKLVNAVGICGKLQCRAVTDILLPETVFLLCSDGLYKLCADRLLRNAAKRGRGQKEMEKEIDKLIGEAYRQGAGDNISVIIVRRTASG